MDLTLVVLAAGMGSRYGGLKQLDAIGPRGELLLDYALMDAARAGFGRAVFIIRPDTEASFRAQIGARYEREMAVEYAFQSPDALPAGFVPPPGRERPWGTGHAVWCARDVVRTPFAVINADDFYGRDAFRALAGFLRASPASETGAARFAMVGFLLANTLSEHGVVSRGICQAASSGRLEAIVERTGIAPADVGQGRAFSGAEVVSMNCWGFTPRLFPALDRLLREFLARNGTDARAEFYLPAAVSAMIRTGEAEVEVLKTEARWHGVTFREDRERVAEALRGMEGEYGRK